MASSGNLAVSGHPDSLAYRGTAEERVHEMDDDEFLAVLRTQVEDAEQFIEDEDELLGNPLGAHGHDCQRTRMG